MPDDRPTEPASGEPDPRITRTRAGIAAAKAGKTFAALEAEVAQLDRPRNVFRAFTRHDTPGGLAAFAGLHAADVPAGRPDALCDALAAAGARGVAVRGEPGAGPATLGAIERLRASTDLPIVRRDLILDPWQLWEARAAGADAVGIDASAVAEAELVDLLILAQQLQMTAIVEAGSAEDLLRARPHVGFPHPTYGLLGIHNGDDEGGGVNQTLRLIDLVDDRGVVVSIGGVRTPDDAARLRGAGVRAAVVSSPRGSDPARALATLLNGSAGHGTDR